MSNYEYISTYILPLHYEYNQSFADKHLYLLHALWLIFYQVKYFCCEIFHDVMYMFIYIV